MRIGVPKESKDQEFRVGIMPDGVRQLVSAGHQVLVQSGAGERIGFRDAEYALAGAKLAATAGEAFAADLVVKVKELQPHELGLPRRGQILFAYLHLAPDPDLLEALLASGASAIAFETVQDAIGRLPLLEPMSRIAGRLSIQVGAWMLSMANGGSGVLLGGVEGVAPGRVVVLGAGVSGSNAVHAAVGAGAQVTVLDIKPEALARIEERYPGKVVTRLSTPAAIEWCVAEADLVVGALLTPGKLAPKLVSRALLSRMRPGSALVDIAIDQGGIAETSRPTSHSDPIYVEEGVVHYCVPNMPSACARTASLALGHATLPYVAKLADAGLAALDTDAGLAAGLQVHRGQVTDARLAQDTGRPFSAYLPAG